MEFLIAVGSKISEYAVEPVGRQLGYLCHYKAHRDNLKTQIQHLEGAKIRLQHSIDEAERNGEEIEVDVQNWLTRVTTIVEEAKDLLEQEDHAKCMSFGNFFLIPMARYRLSKKAKTMADDAAREIQLENTFQKISHRLPPQGVIDYIRDYVTFQSRISICNEIMEAFRNPNVKIIGVSGMGGVGKTMLAKQVSRQAMEEEKLFNKVIMTTVSQTQDLKKIQQEIAEQLGLKLEEESINVRAERLRRRIVREKNFLLILDDVWEKLELHEVGISLGNDQNDCKILLTSRSQDVICNDMGADKNFLIGYLYDEEAKHLFNKIVGDSVKNTDIKPLATEIVRECGGLPLAIVTVANALKNKSHPTWENALRELRRSVPTNIKGMHDKVYSSIRLSYNFLQSEEAKSLLLAFSLFPEDSIVGMPGLLRFGMGLGLFQGMTTLEEARNKVLTLVEILKTSCLLLDGNFKYTSRLHDVVHHFVTFTAPKERQMYRFGNFGELGDNEEVKGATAISLLNIHNLSQIPERLECPQLKLFYVINKFVPNYLQISNQFFEEMKELRVLELSFVRLKQLPSSFCCLQNLQSLSLYNCELGDMALIGELQTLKILQICLSKIEELPKQIGQLTHLQLLDLSGCSKLEVIERDVISSLIHLEELYMVNSFTKWDTDTGDCARRNASLIELKNLPRLTNLYLHIPDVNILPKDLFSDKLKSYEILIGGRPTEWYRMFDGMSSSRVLGLELNISRLSDDHGLQTLLKGSEVLNLYGVRGVSAGGIYGLDREGFPQLKYLIIVNNDEMQYVINSRKQNHPCSVFLSLEELYLEKLMHLEKIFHGKISTNSFGKLRAVRVKDCDRLKNLFPFSIAKELTAIEVINCKTMKEIVTYGREDDPHINATEEIAKIEFPPLRYLKVKSSPALIQFFRSESVTCFTGQMNQELLDVNCPIPLFNKMVAFPRLNFLSLSMLNSKKLWPDQPPETFNMKNLTTLKVYVCNSLKYLLSFDMARSLVQLEHLMISDCSVMEEVLATKDTREIHPCSAFVSLKSLVLKDLENLERICHGKLTAVCFQKLRALEVRNCERLKNVFSLSEAEARFLLQLEYIKVTECNMMEEIFVIEDDNQNINNEVADKIEFPQLRSLNVQYLPKFIQVLTQVKMNATHQRREEQSVANYAITHLNEKVKFPKLKTLKVKGMIGLNAIWNCQYEGLVEDAEQEAGILRRLEVLRLSELPQLMRLWEEDYHPGRAFQNLKDLEVQSCNRLMNLVPSSISFQNLIFLSVSKCHGMEHLLTSSTAKSLTRLRRIRISKCERMIQIMADFKGGDDQITESDEIVFDRLEVLDLDRLPSLTFFSSGNYILRFPNLKWFALNRCPQMRSFCKGDISTPKLEKLILESLIEDEDEDEEEDEDENLTEWAYNADSNVLNEEIFKDLKMQQLIEGDINVTIRQISGSS
ncbi:hypothetical protein FNV43_RR25125 [Rhamnella rubrinervis]|uniref:AAA+ ATPase domain-containing protein n=1 Tax=Rhamnella rubrinervis TaxID=2594499 RepID=A0A8K0GLV9_9ROSA|nr:hypothetical protein FNV43_RR25125 [Rhamnella rubrinervis]